MNKLAAYELLLEDHPLWKENEKVAAGTGGQFLSRSGKNLILYEGHPHYEFGDGMSSKGYRRKKPWFGGLVPKKYIKINNNPSHADDGFEATAKVPISVARRHPKLKMILAEEERR